MGILFRYVLAIFCFIAGVFCLLRWVLMGWEWEFLVFSLLGFLLAKAILPKQKRLHRQRIRQQQRKGQSPQQAGTGQYDLLAMLVEFPIELMGQIILLPLRFFKHVVHALDGL